MLKMVIITSKLNAHRKLFYMLKEFHGEIVFSSNRKLDKQKINNNNNKHIQMKDSIVLYVGRNNRYIIGSFL